MRPFHVAFKPGKHLQIYPRYKGTDESAPNALDPLYARPSDELAYPSLYPSSMTDAALHASLYRLESQGRLGSQPGLPVSIVSYSLR